MGNPENSRIIKKKPDRKLKKLIPNIKRRPRRKGEFCLNCGKELRLDDNYCPNCGQENNHNKASFGTLVLDFFHNYFSLDSKFTNSLLPFFFEPGYLTKKFVAGKRASFVNPVRLYLILSLVFFFVFSKVSSDLVKQTTEIKDEVVAAIPDSTRVALKKINVEELEKLSGDSIRPSVDLDSLLGQKNTDPGFKYTFDTGSEESDEFAERNVQKYLRLRKDKNLSIDQVMDSLDVEQLSPFRRNFVRNLIRLDRSENKVVVSIILKNIPLMMLVIIPILALFLKLLYIGSSQLYITHLIHVLYLHSFAYIIYGLAAILAMYLFQGAAFWILLTAYVIVLVHAYISFRNVYEQKWFITLVKFTITGFVYSFLLQIAIGLEMLLSVATY